MAPSGRNDGAYHRFWQQSVDKELRQLASQHQRQKVGGSDRGGTPGPAGSTPAPRGGLGRSPSTPALKTPFALHDVPEEAEARHGLPPITGRPSPGAVMRSRSYAGSCAGRSRLSRSHSQASTRLSSPSAQSNTSAKLLFFNENSQLPAPPRLRTPSVRSSSTCWTSASALSLRKEVEAAVQEEVAKAMAPLQEKLRSERAAREQAEAELSKVQTPLTIS
mmetsp:Transcript_106409/g.185082  ORF Transcript_106409/g.185082 Transcript_106409/m.185082 type:complete len:220 (-) Transcript_106409:212-871(-)